MSFLKAVKHLSAEIVDGFRRIKIQRLGKSDIQTAYQANPAGIDSQAIANMKAIHAPTSEKGESVVIGYLNKELAAADGEIRVFSIDSNGALQAYLFARNDGNLEVNGDADNMVRFSELETAYNQLKDDFDALVQTFNTHIHTTTATIGSSATPGVISAPTTQGQTSTGDIAPAKIDNVKTN